MIGRLPIETEFAEWLQHPVTEALKRILADEIEEMKRQWAAEVFLKATEFESRALEYKALGRCQTAALILGMTYEQLIGVLEDVNDEK